MDLRSLTSPSFTPLIPQGSFSTIPSLHPNPSPCSRPTHSWLSHFAFLLHFGWTLDFIAVSFHHVATFPFCTTPFCNCTKWHEITRSLGELLTCTQAISISPLIHSPVCQSRNKLYRRNDLGMLDRLTRGLALGKFGKSTKFLVCPSDIPKERVTLDNLDLFDLQSLLASV